MAKLTIYLEGQVVSETVLETGKEYVLGRGTQCDIILSHPKISRQHASLGFDGQNWNCLVLSKFGHLLVNGAPVETFSLTDGSNFSIPPFEFKFSEKSSRVKMNMPVSGFSGTGTARISTIAQSEMPAADKTSTGVMALRGILRRVAPEINAGQEMTIPTGGKFVAGRSKTNDLKLLDPVASRKHFEITNEGSEFILRDLESANKTHVNGREITQHLLQSGDMIQVGAEKFEFEVFNPAFENLPVPLPEPAQAHPNFAHNLPGMPYEGGRAAVKISPEFQQGVQQVTNMIRRASATKNGRMRLALFAVLVIVIGVGLMKNGGDSGKPQKTNASTDGKAPVNGPVSGLDRLTSEQKKFIDETYNIGYNLYTSGHYDQAALEFQKIFQLVEDYKGSRNLFALCQQGMELKKQQDEIERAKREQADTKMKVTSILDECEELLKSKHFGDVEGCVSRTSDLDPDNERGQGLVMAAQQAMQEIAQSQEARAESARRKSSAERNFAKGTADFKAGKLRQALHEFESVGHSSFHDTAGLKSKAAKAVANIKDKLRKESDSLVQEGKSAMDNKDYGAAVKKFQRAIASDPSNSEASSARSRAISELHQQLKNNYGESVIEENLGNIEQAKKKWKEILNQGDPSDDYFQKAKMKLQKYEK
jgi:pSer/pThr/pTyr-binding forkhead associated (FHA) protein/tetratricopeptide (TPR) repeat protein